MPRNVVSRNSQTSYLNLETINHDGSVPESRLTDPIAVQAIVQEMIRANEKRNRTDAKVYGMLSGNPPYSPAKLRSEGQAWRANFNSRIGESFLGVALTAPWDVINEAPTKAEVRTAYGNDDQREDWSGIITEKFEKLNDADAKLNYMFRLSQHDMIAFRYGPVIFDDFYNYRARAISQANLLVEDGAPSSVDEWSIAAARVRYKADELYAFIRNPKAAAQIGFDVAAVRKALLDHTWSSFWPANTRQRDWLWYEQRIRNNDIYISRISDEIPVAHVWYREFPKEGEDVGRISHCMIVEDYEPAQFLFRHVGRFAKWQNVIHPFYYDTGDGTHHSVKGLGIKSYAALELYNRLQCHLADAAFWGSSTHFQARDMAAMQNLAVQAMGPYILHQPGSDLINVQLGGQLDAPIAISKDFLGTLTSNLSQYRQDVQRRRQGSEPPTARQVNYEAENESVIGKSGMSWYFEQLDSFWDERYRRASNPNLVAANPGGKEALAFQKECIDAGVPMEAMMQIEHVRATRTIGYGSVDSRMQSLMRMLSRYALYDEGGKRNLLEDITAADVGRTKVRRYVSKTGDTVYAADQRSEASQWVGTMKVGVAPQGSPSWNPVIFSGVWLQAASDAAASLQQGANPAEVYGFLEIIGPAIRKQLDRLKGDETRQQIAKAFEVQWQKLSQLHDQLGAQLQKQQQQAMQKRQQQMQQAQQINGDLQLKRAETAGKLAISREKQQANLQLKREVHDQNIAIKGQQAAQDSAIADVTTATKIRNETAKAKVATTKGEK